MLVFSIFLFEKGFYYPAGFYHIVLVTQITKDSIISPQINDTCFIQPFNKP